MRSNSAFEQLPQNWQDWITLNIERGCEPTDIASELISNGKFAPAIAGAAIRYLCRIRNGNSPDPLPMPDIDCSSSVLQTPDRAVSILSVFAVPRVVVLGGVLSDEECDVLIQLGAERMKPSLVVADGLLQREPHAGRTSSDAFLQRGMCDVVARVEARLAALVNWPVERGEGLQILQYDQGGEYKPHFDWFDPDSPGGRLHLAHGGQRVGTIVMYLNDAEKGGSTIFPKLGLQVMPKKGNAVFFANTGEFGQLDEMALHGGEPVVAGVKHVATKWLRTREFV